METLKCSFQYFLHLIFHFKANPGDPFPAMCQKIHLCLLVPISQNHVLWQVSAEGINIKVACMPLLILFPHF